MAKVLKRRKKQKPIVIAPVIEPIPANSIETTPPIIASVETFTDNNILETGDIIAPIVEEFIEYKETTRDGISANIERFDPPKEERRS